MRTLPAPHTHRPDRAVRPSARRPVRLLAGVLLAAALGLAGCGGNDSADSMADSASGGDNKAVAGAAPGAEDAGAEDAGSGEARADEGAGAEGADESAPDLPATHIIRTASLTVQVKDVPRALREARSAVEGAGGHIGEEHTTRDEDDAEYTDVTLRVPADAYDKILGELEGVGSGKLLERSTKAEDVTDQVVDVESRIQSQRASVTRIRELMDRAERLSDVVTLEGELSRRQADLEALLARQASLEDRTTLATITLTLTETPVDRDAKDDDPGFLDALSGGWDAFVAVLRWLLVAVGAVLPFAATLAVLLLVWLRLVRPRLPRRAQPAPAPAPVPAPATTGTLPHARPVTADGSAGQAPGAGTPEGTEED
ncbi:DUF4349 domain-containing protein [Streptomyces sp. NPDC093252]|uniref:DUF4349 domain-containing protein n=1 Tax=Streptomyces sp. NPDC093252 TaxID=3154980 RepID=UPI003418F95F